jgi:hypothetical protein
MVEAVPQGVMLAANIDYRVAFGKVSGVAGANEWTAGECWEETEKIDGEGFVGVKVAAVKRTISKSDSRKKNGRY